MRKCLVALWAENSDWTENKPHRQLFIKFFLHESVSTFPAECEWSFSSICRQETITKVYLITISFFPTKWLLFSCYQPLSFPKNQKNLLKINVSSHQRIPRSATVLTMFKSCLCVIFFKRGVPIWSGLFNLCTWVLPTLQPRPSPWLEPPFTTLDSLPYLFTWANGRLAFDWKAFLIITKLNWSIAQFRIF